MAGRVQCYVHKQSVGVMVEVVCDSRKVARSEVFAQLCENLCLQICATAPRYRTADEIPEELLVQRFNKILPRLPNSKEIGAILEVAASRRLSGWVSEVCLLEQGFIKDPAISVREYMDNVSRELGESIWVRRFSRFDLRENIEQSK